VHVDQRTDNTMTNRHKW